MTDTSIDGDPTLDPTRSVRLVTGPPEPLDRPEQIGPYRILRTLGEGGMGIVFEAEQERPVRRKVALKLIKAGMDTRQVIARFESERQALALMNHDNVARVLDAGATEQGRPYFVMEYVAGVPITDYCDRHRLSTEERLELFRGVCDGVHHAHQKGIIHRDLKPSNILVEVHEGRPRPKIIDFGVAKATSQRLSERTLFTEFGVLIGTPEYMSPEQAEMTELDVDTRTDVYSLGVILYELLVGALPFDSKELRRAGYDAIRKRIRDEMPSAPSTKLSTLGDASREVAARRRADVASLARLLRGDLDWITMKAIDKDRTRRYGSASDLSSDIERYLRHEPVTAGPPSAAYRVRKFVRRHRAAVAVSAALALTLLAGVLGTTIGLVQAVRAREEARYEAETSRRVAQFLVDLFEISDPGEARGRSITAREILERGSTEIRSDLAGEPRLKARLLGTIGVVYRNLGLYDDALPLLDDAIEVRRQELGPEHPEVASAANDLAAVYLKMEQPDVAAPLLDEALAIQERAGIEDAELAKTLNHLGYVAARKRDYPRARELWERALAIRERVLGVDSPEAAMMHGNLSLLYASLDEPERARAAIDRAIAIRERVLGEDHPLVASSYQKKAVLLRRQDELAAALAAAERALAIQEKVLAPGHPDTAFTLNTLGEIRHGRGELDQARRALERSVAIHEAAAGEDATPAIAARSNLIRVVQELGDHRAALPAIEAQVRAIEARRGREHVDLVGPLEALAVTLRALGREQEARAAEARVATLRPSS
jgi:non-specific serine/threonine protein kinase/serine/threonine-protein kinase